MKPKHVKKLLMDEIRKVSRRLLRNDDNPHIIGIDRGERNLLYICVIDGQGNIVEQTSLNEIINEYKGVKVRTPDYEQKRAELDNQLAKLKVDIDTKPQILQLRNDISAFMMNL